jgi:hypothetical protein
MKRNPTLPLLVALTLAAGSVNGEPSHKDASHLSAATGSKPGRTGQSSSKSSWETGIHHLQRGPLERQFRVHIPPTLESSTDVPLVLAFHGWGGNEHELHRLDLDRRTESAFALPGRLAGRPPVSQVRQLIRYPDPVDHSPSAMKRSLPITLTLRAIASQRARAAGRTAWMTILTSF